jgi:uncharacterized damage-inducible protein DinB
MSIEEAGVSFKELLVYNHSETMRWKEWFARNPKAWDVSVGGNAATIRGLVLHIFQAEYWFAARLIHQEALKGKLEPKSIEELFALHDEAHEMLLQYIAAANEQELRHIDDLPFISGLKVSKRKMLAQALFHGIHHWAQVAMEVCQAGIPSDGPHDLILSTVMQ